MNRQNNLKQHFSLRLSGGKFANGAMTSAMQHLFNAEAKKAQDRKTYILIEKGLAEHSAAKINGLLESKSTVEDQWESAKSEILDWINENKGEGSIRLDKYLGKDALLGKIAINFNDYDMIIISAHGGTVYFDTGYKVGITIDAFKSDLIKYIYTTQNYQLSINQVESKLDIHRCYANNLDKTDWVEGINKIRKYYELSGKELRDYRVR